MTDPRHVILPPTSFYWHTLDAAPAGPLPRGTKARRQRLGFLFEAVLPVPIEHIHAIYHPLGENRWLACGVSHDTLAEHTNTLTLTPGSLPTFLACDVDPATLNVLVEEFEPEAVRTARRRTTLTTCVLILLFTVLGFIGLSRRAAVLSKRTAELTVAESMIYTQVLPPSQSTLPPAARLTAELRGLGQTRRSPMDSVSRPNTPRTLAALLASWPGQGDSAILRTTTESLSVSPTSISILTRLPDENSAEIFQRELRPPPDWQSTQPTVQRERDSITVRVRMEPKP